MIHLNKDHNILPSVCFFISEVVKNFTHMEHELDKTAQGRVLTPCWRINGQCDGMIAVVMVIWMVGPTNSLHPI